MRFALRCAAATCIASLLAAGQLGASAGIDRGSAGGYGKERGLELSSLDTYETGVFDESAAEIPAFDPRTDRTFVVNAQSGTVDIVRLDRQGALEAEGVLDPSGVEAADGSTIPSGAVVNSVDVARGVVAVTVEAPEKTDLGWAAFFDSSQLEALGAVRVGAQPDSIALTRKARQAVVANEGEPGEDYEVDPEGSISVIDLPKSQRRYDRLRQNDVETVRFTAYDEGTALPEGVRVFGPDVPVPEGQPEAGYVARNLEPEYVTIDRRGRTAYVSIQEANAIAVVDLRSATLSDLWALDLSDWSAPGAALDASDRDDAINLASWPVFGMPMPDGIDTYRYRGKDLVVTANEGDAREFGDFEEPVRIGDEDYALCTDVFGEADALKADEALGRLEATTADGLRAGQDCYEQIQVFGGRSFSIYTAEGDLVFDSAGM
ncbi:MAG: choice-of-anchor I family protein, partial [Ornithinimicrobium sp.]